MNNSLKFSPAEGRRHILSLCHLTKHDSDIFGLVCRGDGYERVAANFVDGGIL